jgi:hypothetical protein
MSQDLHARIRSLESLIRARGYDLSYIGPPEWAKGEEWAGWKWLKRDQVMTRFYALGQIRIDGDGNLQQDTWDDHLFRGYNLIECCDPEVARKMAMILIDANPEAEEGIPEEEA